MNIKTKKKKFFIKHELPYSVQYVAPGLLNNIIDQTLSKVASVQQTEQKNIHETI